MDKYAVWVKASERLPNCDGIYYCKGYHDNNLLIKKLTPLIDNVFMEMVMNEGYGHDEIEWLDESPVDRGVEKAAEESTSENFNTTDLKTNPYYKGFIAGAKWAGNDAVEFADWIEENGYALISSDELIRSAWVNCKENDVYIHGSDEHFTDLIKKVGITTEQLYNLFKQKQL